MEAQKISHLELENPHQGEFARFEEKFILEKSLIPLLLESISAQMDPAYPNEGTKYTLVDSLYFDSPDLHFLNIHLAKNPVRQKLRLRVYGPNGDLNHEQTQVEIKSKIHGKSIKKRFQLTGSQKTDFIGLSQIKNPLDELQIPNTHLKGKKLSKRVEQVNQLCQDYHLKPSLAISCHRLAFESSCSSFRLTIDTDLKVTAATHVSQTQFRPETQRAQQILNKFSPKEHAIMEIKHRGLIPDWFKATLNKFSLERTSFSKYCWGTLKCLQEKGNNFA
jgi:SPX domain protein involved in polyphosphate accumulation